MSTFTGLRTVGGCHVTRNGQALTPALSLKLRTHSPSGFSWGYGGSGPVQLALAILLTELPVALALVLYRDFTRDVVSKWKDDTWVFGSEDLWSWLGQHSAGITAELREETAELRHLGPDVFREHEQQPDAILDVVDDDDDDDV